jgi:hypothetical protein
MYEKLELLIDGTWRQGSTGETEEVINPATEDVIGTLPHASTDDLNQALESAERAFKEWRAVSAWDRGDLLKRAADILRSRMDQVAETMTLEQGKPLPEAKGEILRSVETIEWFAEEGKRAYGRVIPSRDSRFNGFMVTEPIGVALALSPWNFPIITPVRKIAAAQAVGGNPGHRHRTRARVHRCGPAGGRAQRRVRRTRHGIASSDRFGPDSETEFHRLDPRRQASRRPGRPAHDPLHVRARRSFAGPGVRGCRRRSGRQADRRVQVPQRGPGVHLAHAVLRAGLHSR